MLTNEDIVSSTTQNSVGEAEDKTDDVGEPLANRSGEFLSNHVAEGKQINVRCFDREGLRQLQYRIQYCN